MNKHVLLLLFSGIAYGACQEGAFYNVQCSIRGVLSFDKCANDGLEHTQADCFGQGKACSIEQIGCVQSYNCSSDEVLRCDDGSRVVSVKCLNRTLIANQFMVTYWIAQPTGASCGACTPGYPCESSQVFVRPASKDYVANASFKVKMSIEDLDVSGNPSSYDVKTLSIGDKASLRDLTVTLVGVEAEIKCFGEGNFTIEGERAKFEVAWGPAKSNVSLMEGQSSPRYCAVYRPAPPCPDIDVRFSITQNGIMPEVSCEPAPAEPEPLPPECSLGESRCIDDKKRQYCESQEWADEECGYACENGFCVSAPPQPSANVTQQNQPIQQPSAANQTPPRPPNPPQAQPNGSGEAEKGIPFKCLGIFFAAGVLVAVFCGKRWV